MRTGIANLPLHPGRCPRWLFDRMVPLAREISGFIVYEYSPGELLRRLSDPFWFQAFACVLGFDWHSSGVTTTACGALKMALDFEEHGITVAGGKGKTSRKTPEEILVFGSKMSLGDKEIERLQYSSRMSAKVDNSCVQDGFQLYHHCFFFDENGNWAVVQQGMNESDARRYHWLSDSIVSFVEEPHSAICCNVHKENVLDMTAKESGETRETSVDLVKDGPEHISSYFRKKQGQRTLFDFDVLEMPTHHEVLDMDIGTRGMETLKKAYELQPSDYEELVSLKGMGPKTIRALSLVSELIYGARASWKDPARYSFAHGGKDGYPYPVDRKNYDGNIQILKDALENAKLGGKEKYGAIRRLNEFVR